MEKLEEILKNYLNKGSDRIDVTMVLSLIDQFKKDDNKKLLLHNVVGRSEQLPETENFCRMNQNFVCNCIDDSRYPNF
jgi:hypothetical protein